MKIVVTGGNGLVGQAVIKHALSHGHGIVNLDRQHRDETENRVTNLVIDTTNYDAIDTAIQGCDALIHLAAIPFPGRHPDHIVHNNNVVSSYNVLRAAVQVGITRVCQASSINATGGAWSRWPHYDYFPLDEKHPTYNEDPYSLSKWICELQADSIVRRYEQMRITSLRLHGIVQKPEESYEWQKSYNINLAKHLWGYTEIDAAARACLLSLTADIVGHEIFYIVAPQTMMDETSLTLKEKHFPDVPVKGDLSGHKSFYSCQKAEQLLGWQHDIN